jgi:DNA-binding transcriptional ArsR family regulator
MDMIPRALDVLGDPTRRAIVDRLRRGPSPVGQLAAGMPVSRPAVSQHLTVLRTAGLVSEHREGTRRIYRLEPVGIEELRRWVETLAVDARAGSAATDLSTSDQEGRRSASERGSSPGDRAMPVEARPPDEVGVSGRRGAAKAGRSAAPKDASGKKKRAKKRPGKK